MTTQTERSQKLEQELATVQSELADLRGDVTDLQAGRPAPSNGERAITLSAPDAAANGEPTTVRSLHRVIDPGRFREELAAALRDQNGGIALRNLTVKPDRSAAAITWQVPMDQHGQLPGWLRAHFAPAVSNYYLRPVGTPLPPQIDRMVPLISWCRPGGQVYVTGTQFGPNRGELHLGGMFAGGSIKLGNVQWGRTFAVGTIPGDIVGVPDHDGWLQVVRQADFAHSNRLPVRFTAAREIRRIPSDSGAIVSQHVYVDDDFETFTSSQPGGPTVDRYNATDDLDSGSGTDTYTFELQNGWVYSHYNWLHQDGIDGGPFGSHPDPDGESRFTLEISWFFDVGGGAWYAMDIYAVGPAGTSLD